MLWGLLLSYFPTYAELDSVPAFFFRAASIVLYILGIFAAMGGLNEITPNLLLKAIGNAVGFTIIAAVFHVAADWAGPGIWGTVLRVFVLIVGMAGVMVVVMAIPSALTNPSRRGSSRELLILGDATHIEAGDTAPAARREKVVSFIIVVLTLVAATIELVNSMLAD